MSSHSGALKSSTKRKRSAAAVGGVRERTFEHNTIDELGRLWIESQADLKSRTKQNTEARKVLKKVEQALVTKMLTENLETVTMGDKTIVRSKTLSLAPDTAGDDDAGHDDRADASEGGDGGDAL